jgi:hypothetical protein
MGWDSDFPWHVCGAVGIAGALSKMVSAESGSGAEVDACGDGVVDAFVAVVV